MNMEVGHLGACLHCTSRDVRRKGTVIRLIQRVHRRTHSLSTVVDRGGLPACGPKIRLINSPKHTFRRALVLAPRHPVTECIFSGSTVPSCHPGNSRGKGNYPPRNPASAGDKSRSVRPRGTLARSWLAGHAYRTILPWGGRGTMLLKTKSGRAHRVLINVCHMAASALQ